MSRDNPAECRKSARWLWRCYGAVLVGVLAVIGSNPIEFKKSVTIVEGKWIPDIPLSGKLLDVAEFIGSIPYRSSVRMVYAVDPFVKYQRSIIQGEGNCSNMIFGAAYYLDSQGIEYQIIYWLPRRKFLKGDGHAVLRLPYRLEDKVQVGIVDLFEGGLPRREFQYLDVHDLAGWRLTGITIESLSPRKDTASPFYGSYLRDASFGFTPSSEVRRYFRFIQAVYVPLRSEMVEKYVFDALAVIAGIHPRIYVPAASEVFEGVELERAFFLSCLWVLRSFALVIPLMFLYGVKRLYRRPIVIVRL